jgi:hypothetical protein
MPSLSAFDINTSGELALLLLNLTVPTAIIVGGWLAGRRPRP